jgi:NAD(P)-dependent dehydrogenase (short-subunit alcohol dehydrogenase family)
MGERIVAEHDRLDVLVNNAGTGSTVPGGGERTESQDGYELRFQVNYLAEFLLTGLLEPLLVSSAPARIVNVSSAGQMPIDFDNVMLERGYDGMRAYCQSKPAHVMHTFDLAERLERSGVTANCLHPATFMPTRRPQRHLDAVGGCRCHPPTRRRSESRRRWPQFQRLARGAPRRPGLRP